MNIIPMNVPPAREPQCSFCEKPESQVKKLIASADGMFHICGTCVAKATERLESAK